MTKILMFSFFISIISLHAQGICESIYRYNVRDFNEVTVNGTTYKGLVLNQNKLKNAIAIKFHKNLNMQNIINVTIYKETTFLNNLSWEKPIVLIPAIRSFTGTNQKAILVYFDYIENDNEKAMFLKFPKQETEETRNYIIDKIVLIPSISKIFISYTYAYYDNFASYASRHKVQKVFDKELELSSVMRHFTEKKE